MLPLPGRACCQGDSPRETQLFVVLLQLLAAVDLNDPVVHATMLAMLPLPEEDAAEAAEAAAADAAAGRGGNGGGGEGGAGADGSVPLEQALWPVGQVGGCA